MGTLNYEAYFGLAASPFQLSPDPSFLYASEQSKEAIESISGAIEQRKGFIVLTGEVGTGKTLVLRCLLEAWEREQIPFAYFIGPRLSTIDFLSYVIFELGIKVTDGTVTEPSKGALLRGLYGFLLEQFEKGLTTVLIIDEAHLMPRSVLEEIRVLANFETAQQKLIQIVLAGQPELDKKLDSTELRSLKQRIAVRCQLQPLRESEVRHYIQQRLETAGAGERAAAIFPAETVKAIHRYSAGIPRLVNNICDQALIVTCTRQLEAVPSEVIHSVAAHFRLGPAPAPKQPEKRIAVPAEGERLAAEKPLPTVTPMEAPSARSFSEPRAKSQFPSASTTLPTPGLPLEILTAPQTVEDAAHFIGKRESAPKPMNEAHPVSPAFTARTSFTSLEPATSEEQTIAVGEASRGTAKLTQTKMEGRPARTRRWLRPGMLLVSAGVLVPISVAGGLFVARHRIESVAASQPVSVAKLPMAPVASAVMQPASANLIPKRESTSIAGSTVQPYTAATASSSTNKSPEETPKAAAHSMTLASVAPRVSTFKPPVMMKPARASAAIEPPTLSPNGINASANLSVMEKSPLAAITGASNGPVAPPAPPAASNVVPRLLSHPTPEYPSLARQAHTQGDVVVQVVIDKSGNVADATVVSGPSVLREAALASIRKWKYQPLDGPAAQAKTLVTVSFRL